MILLVESVRILAVPWVAAASYSSHSWPAGKIDIEFLLESLAKLIASELVEKRPERRPEAHLIGRKAARCGDYRVIGIDGGKPLRIDEIRDDQMLEWLSDERRCLEGVKSQITGHFLLPGRLAPSTNPIMRYNAAIGNRTPPDGIDVPKWRC